LKSDPSAANMLSDTEATCLVIALAVRLKKKKESRWMKECLKKRNEYTHENLLKDLRLSEPSAFQNFLRLDAKFSATRRHIIWWPAKNDYATKWKKEYYYARCYPSKPASVRFLFSFFPYL